MIIDAFPFHSEFDLLKIRLNVLAPVVDQFVIIESDVTFTGKWKGYTLESRMDELEDFPIKYCKATLPLAVSVDYRHSAFAREYQTRDFLGEIVGTIVSPGDQIIFGDLDEIPNPDAIPMPNPGPSTIRLQQRLFYFYLNAERYEMEWHGSIIMRGSQVLRRPWHQIRLDVPGVVVPDAGWHFSYCMTEVAVRDKLGSFAHTEYDTDDKKRQVLESRTNMRDPAGWPLVKVPINESYPTWLRENQDQFPHLIWG